MKVPEKSILKLLFYFLIELLCSFCSASGSRQYTYIDVFNKGQFRNEQECGEVLAMPFPNMLSPDSYHSISYNKVCQVLALLHL